MTTGPDSPIPCLYHEKLAIVRTRMEEAERLPEQRHSAEGPASTSACAEAAPSTPARSHADEDSVQAKIQEARCEVGHRLEAVLGLTEVNACAARFISSC